MFELCGHVGSDCTFGVQLACAWDRTSRGLSPCTQGDCKFVVFCWAFRFSLLLSIKHDFLPTFLPQN